MVNYLFNIIDTIKLNRVQVYITIISKTFCQTKVYLRLVKGTLVRYCFQATIITHWEGRTKIHPVHKHVNPAPYFFEDQVYEI